MVVHIGTLLQEHLAVGQVLQLLRHVARVDGAAEGGHRVTVNRRVGQQQQQQQQYDADMTNRIHNNDYSLILHFLEQQ